MNSNFIYSYSLIFFDCDGVVLNSNKVKTNAFFEVAKPYGRKKADELVGYHVVNGGISRYKKFEYFIKNILEVECSDELYDNLLNGYSKQVLSGLLSCQIAPGLRELRKATKNSIWFVASGGDQRELRSIFRERGIDSFFDGGIFGSPDTKIDILARQLSRKKSSEKALYIGDSKYDYEVASQFNLDFIFLSGWSEFDDYRSFFSNKNILIKSSLSDLIN